MSPEEIMSHARKHASMPVRSKPDLSLIISIAVLLGISAGVFIAQYLKHDDVELSEAPIALSTRKVHLAYYAPGAQIVQAAGSWSAWSAAELKNLGNGHFEADLSIPEGRHEYMLIVDGKWIPDPAAPLGADDGFGSKNSILEL